MSEDKQNIFEKFGQLLIEKVRDYTIYQMLELVNGKAKAPVLKKLYAHIEHLKEDEKENIKKIILVVIDNSISNFLWMLEQHEEFIDLIALDKNKSKICSIHDLSDGLCGEYWNFIEEHSQYFRGTE